MRDIPSTKELHEDNADFGVFIGGIRIDGDMPELCRFRLCIGGIGVIGFSKDSRQQGLRPKNN